MPGGFEQAYAGVPPWDIGAPQPALVALEKAGKIRGDVLDAGCGTGENALYLASRGHRVVGLDGAPSAIEKARAKARERGVQVEFVVGDALALHALGRQFDAVVDSGLFHVFDDEDRVAYVRSLRSAVRPGGSYHLMCFSDRQPGDWGPRRVSAEELRRAFADGWRLESLEEARFQHNIDAEGARAWLAHFTRLGGGDQQART
jgi:SAM-dependent methyltransferase